MLVPKVLVLGPKVLVLVPKVLVLDPKVLYKHVSGVTPELLVLVLPICASNMIIHLRGDTIIKLYSTI